MTVLRFDLFSHGTNDSYCKLKPCFRFCSLVCLFSVFYLFIVSFFKLLLLGFSSLGYFFSICSVGHTRSNLVLPCSPWPGQRSPRHLTTGRRVPSIRTHANLSLARGVHPIHISHVILRDPGYVNNLKFYFI